ncbi:nucleotidyltransferase substrate binding protein [Cyanobium sp. ATX 6F1]|nr:nucleotidyltransferase substrate binding protein [Cyanobium sp. ATX 6F1]
MPYLEPRTGVDIRWQQRFGNFRQALARLREAVELSQQRSLSDLERQGLIKAFEFTHELSWKTLKDFLVSRGVSDLFGSRDTTREAFAQGLINDGEIWMEMIRHRNLSAHTYDEATVLKSLLQAEEARP